MSAVPRSRAGGRRGSGRRWSIALGSALMALAARAANAPVDADLLEFLGSVDSEEQGWHDYLGSTDMNKVIDKSAEKAGTAPGAKPAPVKPPAKKVQT